MFYCSKVQALLLFLAIPCIFCSTVAAEKSSLLFQNKVHSNIPLNRKNWLSCRCLSSTEQTFVKTLFPPPPLHIFYYYFAIFFRRPVCTKSLPKKHMFTSSQNVLRRRSLRNLFELWIFRSEKYEKWSCNKSWLGKKESLLLLGHTNNVWHFLAYFKPPQQFYFL